MGTFKVGMKTFQMFAKSSLNGQMRECIGLIILPAVSMSFQIVLSRILKTQKSVSGVGLALPLPFQPKQFTCAKYFTY